MFSFIGHQFIGESFYRIFNAYHKYTNYELPSEEDAKNWKSILDTNKSKIIT
jgi:pullulanase/glycogen debranching enzyme